MGIDLPGHVPRPHLYLGGETSFVSIPARSLDDAGSYLAYSHKSYCPLLGVEIPLEPLDFEARRNFELISSVPQ